MSKFARPEDVERNLRTAYDDAWYGHIRSLVRFSLGEKYMATSGGVSSSVSGNIPDDIDLLPRYYEPGQSRRILTNGALMAQKVCYTEPDPDYPDKPRAKEQVTKAFNRTLWWGRPHMGPTKFEEYGDWSEETTRMFMDAEGLGTGFVQIGVRDGWVCIQHHPLARVIWDRHRLSTSRARFVAFVHILSEEEAVSQFGSGIRQDIQQDQPNGNALRTLKAIQYFDMGMGDQHTPTEMWRLGSLGGKVLDVSENVYGCLPFAHMQHLHLYGMRRPVGRIDFQVADQVMRNAAERYMRKVLERGPGFDAVDTSQMDPDDQEAFENGELLSAIRFNVPPMGKVGDYIQRVSPHEPPNGLFALLEYLDRNDPGNSGISDADRANVTSSPRTLGEIEITQEGADTQKAWSERQYARFLERLFHKVNYVAAKLHTAPTPLTINGIPVMFNEPGIPQSNLEPWLTPQCRPLVNEDRLTKMNPVRKMQIADAKWSVMANDPYMNPIEVRKAWLEERGEKDVDRFLNPQAAMAMAGAQGGPMTEALAMTGTQDALPQDAGAV